MYRSQLLGILAVATLALGGCATCCDIYDYAYPTFGGKHERVDPYWGRVGSLYSDPHADPGIPWNEEDRTEEIEPGPAGAEPGEGQLPSPDEGDTLRLRPPDASTDGRPLRHKSANWR